MTRLDEFDQFDPLMMDHAPEPEPEPEPEDEELFEYIDYFDKMYNVYRALETHCKNNALFLDETSGFIDFADFINLMIPETRQN